jgi:hypothetical protein
MMKIHLHQGQSGVSLVEALVAMTVFAIALGLVLGIMNNSMHQQRKVSAEQKAASYARDLIEAIAREVRMDSIDYYKHKITSIPADTLIDPIDHLYLKQSAGQPLEFKFDALTGVVKLNDVDMHYPTIKITSLLFYIRPTSDPFYIKSCVLPADCNLSLYPVKAQSCLPSGMCELVNEQPRVTIVLSAQLKWNTTDPDWQSTIDLQTTVTTRKYQR